jgi:hypothetical protein
VTLADLAARHDVRVIWGGHASIKILVAARFLDDRRPVQASRYLCTAITECERLADEPWMTRDHAAKLRAEAKVYVEALGLVDQAGNTNQARSA